MQGWFVRSIARWAAGALVAVALALPGSAGAFEIYHSPNDDGVNAGVAQLCLGPNPLKIWVNNSPSAATTSGSVCVNGNGSELCGYDARLTCTGGCTFTGFDAQGADVVSNIESNLVTFHFNGGNPINPTAVAERAGLLTVTVTGPCQCQLVGDQWVSASLLSNTIATAPVAAAADSDGDGPLDCNDNCPGFASADLSDTGTLAPATGSDGIGNVCQCGDANNSGQVNSTDGLFINQASLNIGVFSVTQGATVSRLTAPFFLHGRCNVTSPGPGTCNSTDALLINRASIGLSAANAGTKFKGLCAGQASP